MPVVRHTGGGYYMRTGPDFEPGDENEVDSATAERLTNRADFELVHGDSADESADPDMTDGDDEEGERTTESSGEESPVDPGEYSVAELEEHLAASDYTTDELDRLKTAETEGKNRTTAQEAIQSQINSEG